MNEDGLMVNGKCLIARERVGNCCPDCALYPHRKSCRELQNDGLLPWCSGTHRKDGRSVIFVEEEIE